MKHDKRRTIIGLCIALCMLSAGTLAEAMDASVAAQGELVGDAVQVMIQVTNLSEETRSYQLLNPESAQCDSFGDIGTAVLAAGESATFQGSYTPTAEALQSGMLTYTLVSLDGEGESTPLVIAFSAPAEPTCMSVQRTIEPGSQVAPGEVVSVRYFIKNEGEGDLLNISITDPGIAREPNRRERLGGGEEVEAVFEYVADTQSRTTHAEITYSYEQGGERVEAAAIHVEPPVVIEVCEP